MFVSSSKRKSFAKKIIGLKRVALLHTNFVRLISRGPKYTGKPLGSACAFICSFCSWRMSGPCLISPWRALWRTMDKQSHIWKVVSLNKHILLSIGAAVNNSFQYTFLYDWPVLCLSSVGNLQTPQSIWTVFWRTIVWFEPPFAPLRALMPPPPVWDHRSPAWVQQLYPCQKDGAEYRVLKSTEYGGKFGKRRPTKIFDENYRSPQHALIETCS